jgi:hypothetical protein
MQTELSEYLDEKQINKLFTFITESLLLEKPNVPSSFVLDFLLRHYPADGRMAVKKMNPSKLPLISPVNVR